MVLDKNLPDASGLDILPLLHVLCPGTPVILMTAFGDARTHDAALACGAYGVFLKPFSLDDLLNLLRRAGDEAGGDGRERHRESGQVGGVRRNGAKEGRPWKS